MSYSFHARAATKNEVIQKVNVEFDKVVENQPIHSADRFQAVEAVEKFVYAVLPDPSDKQDVSVSVSGSLNWSGSGANAVILGASVNVSASLIAKA